MPFKYSILCSLLDELEQSRQRPTSRPDTTNSETQIVRIWFNQHNFLIPRKGREAVAFLSCLFPHRRPDRVFELRERRLESIIGRALCLGSTRLKELRQWRTRDGVDFASSVERVMLAADSVLQPDSGVTVEWIDEVFDRIAAKSSFSSSKLRTGVEARQAASTDPESDLAEVFRRLGGLEAKWLVRMLLKDYSPIHVPEKTALQCFHFLFPDLLGVQNTFEAAVELLREPTIAKFHARVAADAERLLRELAIDRLHPQVGTMITRPEHDKARSIKHCTRLAHSRRMSVERKYDGEYCQVHINLTRPTQPIQIFSKSGKDSTSDREGLHPAIRESLRLGTADCVIKHQCILEGELLVWNDRRHRLEPFHKIRKHVKRSGRFLGTLRDSPADLNEHLMIMFYDILLWDNISCIRETLERRRQRLCSLIQYIRGQVDIGSREIIDFSSDQAPILLQEEFTRAMTNRWEGLVLKGCDDPYFSIGGTRFIKMKKDYIAGLGDTVDLAIVGGRRDATDEQELNVGKLRWTSFHIGCLENKSKVCHSDAKPHFRILAVVGRHSISKTDMRYLNKRGNFVQVPFAMPTPGLSVTIDQKGMSQPTELFRRPFVVEVMGAGFDKPANVSYFTLQFPRVQKIHLDRTIKDTVSFAELQKMAQAADIMPQTDDEDSETDRSGMPPSSSVASPTLSNRSTSTESCQSSINTSKASRALSQDERMRAQGLVMIDEPKTTTAKSEEQQTNTDCNKGSTDPHQKMQLNDSTTLHETAEYSENSGSQASLTKHQPTQTRIRCTGLEIPDSQPENLASSSVVPTPKRARTRSVPDVSPPGKKVKRIKSTFQDLADDTHRSMIFQSQGRKTTTKSSPANTYSSLDHDRGQHPRGSKSALASQVSRINPHPQVAHFHTDFLDFLDFLSKVRMPLFVCDSSKPSFLEDVCQEIAISFTFSPGFFVESVLAASSRVDSGSDKRSCWHIVLARLDGYQSFSAEVQALVSMMDKHHAVPASDFHILFADASLFQPLLGNDDRSWRGAIQAYLRYGGGKVVQVTYGLGFRANFLQGIR